LNHGEEEPIYDNCEPFDLTSLNFFGFKPAEGIMLTSYRRTRNAGVSNRTAALSFAADAAFSSC
jgi:hypothetical protein